MTHNVLSTEVPIYGDTIDKHKFQPLTIFFAHCAAQLVQRNKIMQEIIVISYFQKDLTKLDVAAIVLFAPKNVPEDRRETIESIFVISRELKIYNNSFPKRIICGSFIAQPRQSFKHQPSQWLALNLHGG